MQIIVKPNYATFSMVGGGRGSGVLESTPTGFCVFFGSGVKTFENLCPDPKPLFIFGGSRSLRSLNQTEEGFRQDVIFGCRDGFRSFNRIRILKFEKTLDLDPDSKILELESCGVWKCDSGHLWHGCSSGAVEVWGALQGLQCVFAALLTDS